MRLVGAKERLLGAAPGRTSKAPEDSEAVATILGYLTGMLMKVKVRVKSDPQNS